MNGSSLNCEGTLPLICPKCTGSLTETREKATCTKCLHVYEVKDGIPVLRQNNDVFYGEFPQADMKRLLEEARTDLEGTIRRYLRERDAPPRLGEYILGCGRAGWQYLLPINKTAKVLDLGCGWGTLAWSLSNSCGHVVACDSTLERMQLLGLRRQFDGLKNLQLVCAGDGNYLPFSSGTFDIVVVNGVLEWVPSGLFGNPRDVQLAFLREIRRVLKHDGCLFLGIENRYAWKTWFMNADGHTALRFVPWLPRWMADLYSRINGKGNYRNFLYGRRGYCELLSAAGFDFTEFYVPSPGYHHPLRMVDIKDKKQLRRVFSRPEATIFRRLRQKIKSNLSATFPDAFGIIGSGRAHESFLTKLVCHIQQQFGGSVIGADQFAYRMNGDMGVVTVIVRSAEMSFILKLPIHERGLLELRAENNILLQLAQSSHPLYTCSRFFAKNLLDGTFLGQPFYVYSLLPGVSGDDFAAGSALFKRAVANASKFLGDLHAACPNQQITLEQLVEPTRRAVLAVASSSFQIDTVNRVSDQVLNGLRDMWPTATWSHGDAKLGNFLFDEDTAELLGVVDWGRGLQPELPGYDLSFLFVSSETTRRRVSLPSQLKKQHADGIPEHLYVAMTDFYKHAGIDFEPAEYKTVISYQWLKRLASLGDRYESVRFNHRYLDEMFDCFGP